LEVDDQPVKKESSEMPFNSSLIEDNMANNYQKNNNGEISESDDNVIMASVKATETGYFKKI
jgi:hypothetical protein